MPSIPSPVSVPRPMAPGSADLETFAAALAPLAAICRPALTLEQVQGYYLALGDVPRDVMLLAAAKIACGRIYPTFPMPGEIRAAAVEITAGQQASPTFAAAWRLALDTAKRLSRETNPSYRIIRNGKSESPQEHNERILGALPPLVANALRCFGRLEDDEVCRAQFRRMYEDLVGVEQTKRLLPAALAEQIEAIASRQEAKALPDSVKAIAGRIGLAS